MKIDEHIIFQNDDLIAFNKPSGMLTIPDRAGKNISLKDILQKNCGNIYTVHRLDRDTSGIVVFARNEQMHKHLSQQFEKRETEKIYFGLVLGSPANKSGVINEPIAEHPSHKGLMTVFRKGKESVTEYSVVEDYRIYSWMKYKILTGRTHQIRVHMKHIGHPVACDPLYGDGKPVFISQFKRKFKLSKSEDEERPVLNRLALHAGELSFAGFNEAFHLEAPLPKDLRAVVNQLQKWKK